MTPNKAPSSRAAPWIALVAVTVAALALLLWLLRPAPRPEPSARRATTGQGNYHNRSILRPVVAGTAAPAPDVKPTIQGYVYDATGNGISGVTVAAATFDRAGNVPSPVGATRTDSSGRFAIPLTPGSYQVTASMTGYGPSGATAEAGDTVSLVLHKAGAIQGHVIDDHGQPVTHFTIDVLFSTPGDAPALPPAWSKTFESADGSYRADQIPPFPVVVRAVADAFAPTMSSVQTVRTGETRDVDLTLTQGCTLKGTVVDKKGNPIPRVLVNADARVATGTAMDPVLQTNTQAQSADDGSFALEHVSSGKVVVRGYDGDYAVSTVTVDVGACDKLQPVKLSMTTGGAVDGVAHEADGKPAAGALVSISSRALGFVDVQTDAAGHFHFDALPVGEQRIELVHKGQRQVRSVVVKDGETAKVDLALFAGGEGEIRGRVTAGSKPISGARVLVASNHGQDGLAFYFPVTGDDGTYRVPSLPEGNYIVTVIASRASSGVQVSAGEPTTVNLDAGFMDTPRPRTSQRTPQAPTPSP